MDGNSAEEGITLVPQGKRRKRPNPKEWKRNKAKKMSDLSIPKLCHMCYNNSCNDDLSVFVSEFNIGFKNPATDYCYACMQLGKGTEGIKGPV
ncbi:hypothetical protein PR048_021079 [Dryococelus australis]|uniref:Uncharacterized protein n=1 Tax=Dryococelus australis TaxID=614101 RepID=A0ABQ9GX80_9NEOP|nr:hypothetical protein PR048_021079 [Dryococelus australis]